MPESLKSHFNPLNQIKCKSKSRSEKKNKYEKFILGVGGWWGDLRFSSFTHEDCRALVAFCDSFDTMDIIHHGPSSPSIRTFSSRERKHHMKTRGWIWKQWIKLMPTYHCTDAGLSSVHQLRSWWFVSSIFSHSNRPHARRRRCRAKYRADGIQNTRISVLFRCVSLMGILQCRDLYEFDFKVMTLTSAHLFICAFLKRSFLSILFFNGFQFKKPT